MSAAADRNLLFGILALQLDFISREQLIGGMQSWVLAKDQQLADILALAGALSVDDRATLEAVVARHLHNHRDDPQQSPAVAGTIGPFQPEATRLSEPVAEVPLSKDPFATTAAKPASEGRYQILRPHAEGGLGKVFVARDAELNREVALKEIQPHYSHDSHARARFTLEAEITGRLEHPGIVPVYGLGTYADGSPYYAMRFIRGESLKEAIARHHNAERTQSATASEQAVELRQLLGRFIDVCQAVQYAHDRGVLHRDLKPANVMLGKYGETLVVDWGLAKAEGKNVEAPSLHEESQLVPASGSEVEPTQMGTMVGTLQYMSPEQAIGRMDLIGPATDVFALGATLYHILTGQAPYQATTRDELISAVREGRFPPPRQIKKCIAPPLESICLRALACSPSDRYTSAGQMLQDVERWLAEEPVTAHRESFSERMHRWRRKNPNLISGVRAALIIGILGLCAGTFVMRDMNGRLAQSNVELEQACRRAYLSMQEANQERERSRQTIRFLSTALGKLNAGENGKQIPAATLLARAMQEADAEFADDHELKSRVSEILTTAMQGLGLAEETLAMHHRELHEMSKHCNTHDPKMKDCVNDLANAYLAAGRSAEAIAVLEKHAMKKPLGVTPVAFKPQSQQPSAAPASSQAVADLHAEIDRHAEQAAVELDVTDPLITLDRHAATHFAKGEWDQVFLLKEAAIRISTAQTGRDSAATLARLKELAELQLRANRSPPAPELRTENP
jgi:serine/threonine protein kinase